MRGASTHAYTLSPQFARQADRFQRVTSPFGDVGDVTFREPRFSYRLAAIAFALCQKVTSPTSPAFLGHAFFRVFFGKEAQLVLPHLHEG